MIAHRARENRRLKALKLPKNLERLYKEKKCRECAVVVTRMDFAKILGKFTKVKIQYESSSTPKTKKNSAVTSPNSNARLKSNENGMVLIHRNAYSQHPVKQLASPKISSKTNQNNKVHSNNVLKENNRLKRTPIVKDRNSNINITSSNLSKREASYKIKRYGIVFENPKSKTRNILKSKISLPDLLPLVDKSILPSEEWSIDYMPRSVEPTNDKVYDRIAAELEDLMNNEKKPEKQALKPDSEGKADEFPSIMDILNDNTNVSKPNDQSTSIEYKSNLESSDVEAMLLGKSTSPRKETIEVNADMSNLIEDVAQLNAISEPVSKIPAETLPDVDNPHSPSILDEALQKGIEEHLPCARNPSQVNIDNGSKVATENGPRTLEGLNHTKSPVKMSFPANITHLVFKKSDNGKCLKSVTCPKNLKYSIELDGKTVEFLGAPQFISSLEDLQVLLQIVNETELKNLYVYH